MVAISPANEITVVKSPTDRRRYRFIELTNGLCALLVSDRKVRKGERKAAAAMCVGLGSFADPKEAQGLSHFLEHVLFLGSTDFPEENEFNSYLSEHGGYTNACTEMERASFYFDVDGEFLYDALRRWVPFFISPLMNQEAMQREICSVDSEFHNILWDDFERLQQLQCHTSTPGHPFNRFSWGNKKSLTDAVNFNSLRDSLKKLYNDYFHGELMKLVVIGGERLDILESWVLELFGSIKRGPLVKAQTSSDGPIWKDGKLYKLEAVADVHILVLSWTLPSLWKHYLNKVEAYIAYLLGHEGEGSVFHLLTTKGWASSLHAGVLNDGMHRSSIAYVFCMTIHLTNSGVKKIFEVIDVVYQYLKQLSLQQWIFDELCNSGKLEFMLAEKQAHLDYAKDLAEKLHLYPPQHVIYGAYAYETWDKEMINHILSFFHPKNMRVDLQTHCFEDSLGFESKRKRSKSLNIKTETWFGSRYIEVDIPHDWIKSWQHPLKIHPSLGLPEENIFIAHDVTRRATMKVNKKVCEMEKKCALNEPMITLWYKHEKIHRLPLVNASFLITLNGGDICSKKALMIEIFTLHLKAELNEVMYQAKVANLESSIFRCREKLVIKVDGLVDMLSLLLSKVLGVLKSFLPKVNCFKVIKEDMQRTLKNANKTPLEQGEHALKRVLFRSLRSVEDDLRTLRDLSFADLEAFIPDLLSKVHIEGYCYGDLRKEEALKIAEIFKSKFSKPLVPPPGMDEELVVRLPRSADLIIDERVKNEMETNSVLMLYYQIGRNTIENYTLVVLFEALVGQLLFNELRTKMQLGYDVSCEGFLKYDILGLVFSVQSCEYDPVYLQNKVEAFINKLEKTLKQITNQKFENCKRGSQGKLLDTEDLDFLIEKMEFGKRTMLYDLEEIREEYFRKNKGDIIHLYRNYLRKPHPQCRRLAIRVWGNRDSSRQVIGDIDNFKRQTTTRFYTDENEMA